MKSSTNISKMDSEKYSDDGYEEAGFEQSIGAEGDDDEVERIRKAMDREKVKAQKFNMNNVSKRVEQKPAGKASNPL